jgi:uncharacterized protein (DUF302 family)
VKSIKGVTVEEMTEYGYSVEVDEGYDEAVIRARLALKSEGFSIITEMHVGGMLGPEAGAERQYLFMGAWSPVSARRNIDSTLQAAVHLPCNVVVQETGSSALVAALDPVEDTEAAEGATDAADDARQALARVFSKVSGGDA